MPLQMKRIGVTKQENKKILGNFLFMINGKSGLAGNFLAKQFIEMVILPFGFSRPVCSLPPTDLVENGYTIFGNVNPSG